MGRIIATFVDRVCDAADDLELAGRSLDALAEAFGTPHATHCTWLHGHPWRIRASRALPPRADEALARISGPLLMTHPLFRPTVAWDPASKRSGVVRITDCTTAGAWRRNPIYADVLQPLMGVPLHSVVVPVQNRQRSHLEWFQLTRDSDFTALEVDQLEEIQQVFLRFRSSLTRRQDALRAAGLTAREREVLVLVGQG